METPFRRELDLHLYDAPPSADYCGLGLVSAYDGLLRDRLSIASVPQPAVRPLSRNGSEGL